MNRTAIAVVGMFIAGAALAAPAGAQAGGLQVTEHTVTATTSWENWPKLGNDGVSNLVTFTRSDALPNGQSTPGEIWLQRLDGHGVPMGPEMRLSSPPWDNQANDVFGDYVVWTVYENTQTLSGRIWVYQISSGVVYSIGSGFRIGEPNIHGNWVTWTEWSTTTLADGTLKLYDLAWLGTSHTANTIAGPVPNVWFKPDVGERYVAWSEWSGPNNSDISAYDLSNHTTVHLTATPDIIEKWPSTSGAWIVWEAHTPYLSSIVARNMDTGEVRVVAEGGVNFWPCVSDDVISYAKQVGENYQAFLYRISTRETWPLSTPPSVTAFPDVFGNLVAYVNDRTGNGDVYVAEFAFVPASHCVAKTNSQGCVPAIGYSGTPALSGPDDFFVTASNVLNNAPGMLIWSGGPASTPFAGGTLCLAPPILRTPLQSSGGNPPPNDCSGSYSFHFSRAFMATHFLSPGTNLCAQYYSRDQGFAPPNNVGLTDALHFTIGF